MIEIQVRPFDTCGADLATLEFLAALVNLAQPKVLVEAGSYCGHFALYAAKVMADWGGEVWTADPLLHDNWTALIASNGLTNLHYVPADFGAIPFAALGPVDFAFVDSGAPFANGWEDGLRLRHYELAKQVVRPGGLIVTDDTAADDWQGVQRIRAEAALVLPGARGLSVRVN